MSAGSTTIEASLRLDIAQLQAQLAASKGEATKWREKMQAEGRKAPASVHTVAEAYALTKAKAEQAKAVNPWTGLSASAIEYANVIKQRVNAEQERAAAFAKNLARFDNVGQKTREIFAPKASNPWASGAPAYQQQLQAREAMRAHQAEQERQALLAHQSTLAYRETINPFVGRRNEGFDTNRILAQQAMRDRTASVLGRSNGRGGGGGGFQMGNAAMQVQDIAVQLQMGAKYSTIIAQQGSQMLSTLGVGGAILGGAVAIGGAFATMAVRSHEGFQQSIADAVEFQEKIKVVKSEISSSNLSSGLDVVREQMAKIRAETEQANSFSGEFATNLGRVARAFHIPGFEDAKTPGEKSRIQNDQAIAAEKAKRELVEAAMAASAKETEIAKLRASLRNEEADAMERQLKLSQELARIDALNIPQRAKDQLKADAQSKSEYGAATPRDAKKDREAIAALEERIVDLNLRQLSPAERFLALAKEQEAVFEKMATTGGLFYEQSIAGLEAWAEAKKKMGDNAGAIDVLKQLEKAKALQAAMNQANTEAKNDTVKNDREADRERDEAKRIKQMREELDIETKIAREQVRTGKDDTRTIQNFRDELNTKQLTAQLQEQLKIGEKEALKMAKEKVMTERAATDAMQAQVKAEEAKKQLRSRQELAAEMRVEKMRAEGDTRGADAQERQIRVAREAQEIQQRTGYDEAKAMAIARERVATQERAEKRERRNQRGGGSWSDDDVRPRISAHIKGSQDEIRARNNARSREGWTHPGARDRDAWQPSRMSEQSWGYQGDTRAPAPMAGMAEANAAKTDTAPRTVTFGTREFETLQAIKVGIEKLLG